MSWDPTPWAIGGGAEVSMDIARVLAYASTSGAEGIVTPTDLRVRALATPGTSVRVMSGAALVRNRYAGGQGQTYAIRNTAQHNVPVTATGSGGGRTDLVVARVHDHQYGGEIPSDPTDFQYVTTEIVEGVPSDTTRASDLNLGYPAIALARIQLPSSTATVTDAMITDVREVALPRRHGELRTYNLAQGDDSTLSNSTAYPVGQTWPPSANQLEQVWIPEWATRVRVLAFWSGVIAPGGGSVQGYTWVQIGMTADPDHFVTQGVYYNTPEESTRLTLMVADDRTVPAALRGTRQRVYPRGNHLGGPAAGRMRLNPASAIALQFEFYETPA